MHRRAWRELWREGEETPRVKNRNNSNKVPRHKPMLKCIVYVGYVHQAHVLLHLIIKPTL